MMNKAMHYSRRLTDKPQIRIKQKVELILLFLTGAAIGSALTNLAIIATM